MIWRGYAQDFLPREFECPCRECPGSIEPDMELEFIRRLQGARILAERPFVINSGFRCQTMNGRLVTAGSAVPDSAHLSGLAADISTPSSQARREILFPLVAMGFARIGVYPTHLHDDLDETKPQVVWLGAAA